MKPGEAFGLNNLPPKAVREIATSAADFLRQLMNNLIVRRIFPDSWKVAMVALILKSGNPSELASAIALHTYLLMDRFKTSSRASC